MTTFLPRLVEETVKRIDRAVQRLTPDTHIADHAEHDDCNDQWKRSALAVDEEHVEAKGVGQVTRKGFGTMR